LLGDLVVIWRASVLFPDHQRVILGPFILWLATVGKPWVFFRNRSTSLNLSSATDAAYLIWSSTPSGYESYSNGFNSRYTALFHASLGLSIATNAITTAMIGYKLWYVALGAIYVIQHLINARTYRNAIVKNLRVKASKNPMQNMLILLVESGLLYLGFQVSLPRWTRFV